LETKLPARGSEHWDRWADVSRRIVEAQRPIRILRALAWPDSVAREFFAARAERLPRPTYHAPRDLSTTLDAFAELRRLVPGENPVERWLRETCESWEAGARLLGAVGTREFHARSVECFGRPDSLSSDGKTTNAMLAEHFDRVMAAYASVDLSSGDRPMDAADVAYELERRLRVYFEDVPIRCELADGLTANAVASADVVKIKRGAPFTARDVEQLYAHEGHVHLGTTLNGRKQPILAVLAIGAPRTTRTQEGLAIFAELVTHAMDLGRLRRLTDRILAVRMSEQGADFIELYRFFLERGHAEPQAFDCARRVVRGGLVEGGAPCTKDVVYLDGLRRVAEVMRVALTRGWSSWVALLFAGKLAVEDLPLLDALERAGVVASPRFVPPWARDLGFLTAQMSFSVFLERTDLSGASEYYERQVAAAAELAPVPSPDQAGDQPAASASRIRRA
jgi:uncharacterized protein (TIGR02421 family)